MIILPFLPQQLNKWHGSDTFAGWPRFEVSNLVESTTSLVEDLSYTSRHSHYIRDIMLATFEDTLQPLDTLSETFVVQIVKRTGGQAKTLQSTRPKKPRELQDVPKSISLLLRINCRYFVVIRFSFKQKQSRKESTRAPISQTGRYGMTICNQYLWPVCISMSESGNESTRDCVSHTGRYESKICNRSISGKKRGWKKYIISGGLFAPANLNPVITS